MNILSNRLPNRVSALRQVLLAAVAATAISVAGMSVSAAQDMKPKAYPAPEAAAEALIAAARAMDGKTLTEILGSDAREWMLSGDAVQDRQGIERFTAAYDAKHELEKASDTAVVLSVGEDDFPFPIPIVKQDDGWAFDPEQGREEILNRRIGRNELNTIQVLLALVDAEEEYARFDRNGDGLREYAAKFRSSEGKRDGLYWPTAEGEPLSPLGPLVAEAVKEGYTPRTDAPEEDNETGAYHGYHFKLLTRQGPAAPGGAHDYMIDGKLVGGFAALAYPARYGNSGVMTFMVSHDGRIYEANLGPETEAEVQEIDTFDPSEGWTVVEAGAQ
jgi:hypothetical protein